MTEPRRYSRPISSDLKIRKKSFAGYLFWHIDKIARFKVRLAESSTLYPKPHNRSIRHSDIINYVKSFKQDGKVFSMSLDLNDFFNGEELIKDSISTDLVINERPKYPRGFSVYQAESFINETKCCRCYKRKQIVSTNLHPLDMLQRNRPSWVTRPRVFSVPKIASTFDEPINLQEPIYESKEYLKDIVQGVIDNSNRVAVGIKMMRSLFGFQPTNQNYFNRPYFTIYITLVQFVSFIVLIYMYGIAPIGIGFREVYDEVLMPDLSVKNVAHFELQNLWIGPRQEDLIRVGARFTPCMKLDPGIKRIQEAYLSDISKMGCCINKDGSGCLQTLQDFCFSPLSVWLKDKVCGQDPNYCNDRKAKYWPKNKTEWPICENPLSESLDPSTTATDFHMQCQLVGKPCCIGLLGICIITTREYCDFRRGVFYQEAFLCSQVNCFQEMCGMVPFSNPSIPDQFFRVFTSTLIIPGLLVMVLTLLFQLIIMYDLERLTGTFEMAIVYTLCGCCGNIFSGIFMPYYVEIGPSGSQFGVLAILFVEIIRWNIQERPNANFFIAVFVLLFLFSVGLLVPQVDNWAHSYGLFYGAIVAITFRPVRRIRNRPLSPSAIKFQRYFGIIFTIAIPVALIMVFYFVNFEIKCDACVHFNCIRLTKDYCAGTSITLEYNNLMLVVER